MAKSEKEMIFRVGVPSVRFADRTHVRIIWCEENIGERHELWTTEATSYDEWKIDEDEDENNILYYCFVNGHDATLFALRWGGIKL